MNSKAANKINNSNVMDNEIRHIRNLDSITKLAVKNINEKVDIIGYLEEDVDSDCQEYEYETIEFAFLDLMVWVDIRVQNDLIQIECIDVKDNDDNDYDYISKMLNQNLSRYYSQESRDRSKYYNQAVEIQHDEYDPYNLRPKMPLGHDIKANYIEDLRSICEDDENKLNLFLECGSAGQKIRLINRIKYPKLVNTILPMVKNKTFKQINISSDHCIIGGFIYHNFMKFDKSDLNRGTLNNAISRYF